jgi:glycerol-3-phosphate acyltransferase PlsY
MFRILLGIAAGYLIGSLPFGIIVTRIFKAVDVRNYGSGSSGFTNVYRVCGIGPALIVAVLDIAKGFVAAYIGVLLFDPSVPVKSEHLMLICGCAGVIGHIFTIFARFRGGKGVLTALGVCIAALPLEATIAIVTFAIVFALTRYISAGSMIAAATLPLSLVVEKYGFHRHVDNVLFGFTVLIAVVIFYSHRGNIRRILNGEEHAFKRVDR